MSTALAILSLAFNVFLVIYGLKIEKQLRKHIDKLERGKDNTLTYGK